MWKRGIITALLALVCFGALAVGTKLVGDATLTNRRIVSARNCKVHTILGENTSGSTVYILCFETNNLPANGAVAKFSTPVAANQYYSIDFGAIGVDLDALTVCESSTARTLTIGSSNITVQAVLTQTQ